jgi:rSAM/selenodomain-associated transferase 2
MIYPLAPALSAATPALVSVIVPTYNEAAGIEALLRHLRWAGTATDGAVEVVVVDGQSTDATGALARQAGARVITSPRKGRAPQLNYGAKQAVGSILYFLHADTLPPMDFLGDIRRAVAAGYGCGCYRLAFDEPHWFLRVNAWFTRFNANAVRFGDQSLFVLKAVFEQAGGFREDLLIMEDQEIIGRLKRHTRLRVLRGPIVTSARKYLANGVFRLQGTFVLLATLYYLGVPQPTLLRLYRKFIRQDKL